MCSDMPLPASYATEAEKVDALWVTVTAAIEKLNCLWSEVALLRSQVDKLNSSQSEVSSLRLQFRDLEEGLLEALVNVECRLDVLRRSQTTTDLGPETTDTCLDCMD
eukprot:s1770_g8.t1